MMKDKKALIQREGYAQSALHIREKDGEQSRTITGYAILFNTPSLPLWQDETETAIEEIAPEAVTRDLLDACDIKFTLFHDRQLLLARSVNGEGTLRYDVDDKGVSFEFDAPNTADGDKALELVRRGDLAGCSFAFRTNYWDEDCVERIVTSKGGSVLITYRVKVIRSIHDFTLAADPAYPDTTVEAREFIDSLRTPETTSREDVTRQVAEMRHNAKNSITKF